MVSVDPKRADKARTVLGGMYVWPGKAKWVQNMWDQLKAENILACAILKWWFQTNFISLSLSLSLSFPPLVGKLMEMHGEGGSGAKVSGTTYEPPVQQSV